MHKTRERVKIRQHNDLGIRAAVAAMAAAAIADYVGPVSNAGKRVRETAVHLRRCGRDRETVSRGGHVGKIYKISRPGLQCISAQSFGFQQRSYKQYLPAAAAAAAAAAAVAEEKNKSNIFIFRTVISLRTMRSFQVSILFKM
jgi:hypothetical protein